MSMLGEGHKYMYATQGEDTDYSSRRQRAPIYIRSAPGSRAKKKPVDVERPHRGTDRWPLGDRATTR